MSNEMVERVANELYIRANDFDAFGTKKYYLDVARAAIAAMREPTDKMIKDTENVTIVTDEKCKEIYQCMIDAALKDD